MDWTSERPKTDGYYWLQGDIVHVYVFEDGDGAVGFVGTEITSPLSSFDGNAWFGPLVRPSQ